MPYIRAADYKRMKANEDTLLRMAAPGRFEMRTLPCCSARATFQTHREAHVAPGLGGPVSFMEGPWPYPVVVIETRR